MEERYNTFDDFFKKATCGKKPYPYQRRMAEEVPFPSLLKIPTGAGKTAAVILSWLWRRRYHMDPEVRTDTPRRLVYCLPMRVLVEQTYECAKQYLQNLGVFAPFIADDPLSQKICVEMFMGGEVDDDWDCYPEREMILVGTQDMLLSRALNRGYAMSRYRWPVQFGLLNNDSLWILDEVQLMGSGLGTTTQLAAFRKRFDVFGICPTLWMSATLQPEWMDTVDFRQQRRSLKTLTLSDNDRDEPRLVKRLQAKKILQRSSVTLLSNKKKQDTRYYEQLACEVLNNHQRGTLTLVVVNTVERATGIYRALRKEIIRGSGKDNQAPELLLLHSRFRPRERQEKLEKLIKEALPSAGRIVVATQVVEAGLDISSRTLFTELAPWASLVQRFGRCNREGEWDANDPAQIFWIDIEDDLVLPYEASELKDARAALSANLNSAAPAELPDNVFKPLKPRHVLRSKDLLDLFDNTPDLSGNDVDVSRFIRDGKELDLQVFWRDLVGGQPPKDLPAHTREELCPVPFYKVQNFLKEGGLRRAWRWDYLEGQWQRVFPSDVRPGQILLFSSELGGYDPETGWDPESKAFVQPISTISKQPEEAHGDDPNSFRYGNWLTLSAHLDDVVREAKALLDHFSSFGLSEIAIQAMMQAARWHDAGKAHDVFQKTLLKGLDESECQMRSEQVWAKSADNRRNKHERPHFRHELASALALLKAEGSDLGAYLAACHHGKIRLAIRSLPGEKEPTEDKRFALGVWDGDVLHETNLGGGERLPETVLDLSIMELGLGQNSQRSWLERSLELLKEYGPFRLAFLEALLRIADVKASAFASNEDGHNHA